MVQKETNDKAVLVVITVPDRAVARTIATALVERHLAAAVHITEIDSVFRWKGAVREGLEVTLTAKTLAARFNEIEAVVEELHPYELPPLLQVDIERSTQAYADWIAENACGTKPQNSN